MPVLQSGNPFIPELGVRGDARISWSVHLNGNGISIVERKSDGQHDRIYPIKDLRLRFAWYFDRNRI